MSKQYRITHESRGGRSVYFSRSNGDTGAYRNLVSAERAVKQIYRWYNDLRIEECEVGDWHAVETDA